uniref:hypothetical protein n=1 Tax=uncultured Draconibacterium sp. TaxID=1573823 RepID=UPI003216ABB0
MSFTLLTQQLKTLVLSWETRLMKLNEEQISIPRNRQNRTIKQIVGHMIDSASNNTHRVVHLQYRESPVNFPNYATYGNNDRWIAIQNYQNEDWDNLVQLWKYAHLHLIHIIENIVPEKVNAEWLADTDNVVSLKEMVEDFPRHFELHISEIEELLNR